MSDTLGSNATPESKLRFSFEELYAAGKRLGPVESSLKSPTTTFEALQRRADELVRRVDQRKARRITALRTCAAAMIVCGAALLLASSDRLK